MTKIIIHGANGFMGRVLAEIIAEDPAAEVVCGIDIADNGDKPFPMYTNVSDCDVEADVLIDFSTAKAVDALLDYCEKRGLPAVVCTTGLSDEQLANVEATSKKVAILRSANMSLGVNTLMEILAKYSNVFVDAGFDVEIVEKHHNRKLDAPSGTAIALAESVNESLTEPFGYELDRASKREKRGDKEIGIVAVRGGNIVGEHEVIFAGMDEIITLKHTANSRGVFAKGAVEAAKFLAGKPAALYNMSDVIKNK